jgi:O-antigen biosynthesis protein WbqV
MLLVSTDKAVDPTAVMGASKRLAELYCQALDADLAKSNGPRVMSARLGNVLGSAGSVVQIFDRQIQAGGPVTVTDPDAMRYFITIPQAADFLLSAAADSLSVGAMRGAVHVMEMGEPLLIADLARDMIRLAGQRPDVDIKVSFMGLRPGEKVSERLIAADEWVVERRTASGIFLVKASPRSLRVLDNALDQLIESARQRRDDDVRRSLMALASPPDAAADGAAKAG